MQSSDEMEKGIQGLVKDACYCFIMKLIWVFSFTSLYRIGLLLLSKPLDRETTDQYRLIVTASDGNPGGVRHNPYFN